ncbi:ACP phosphodiesterase [Motiliproteus sp. MSK22-1]|uniref:acyl carrier protein phosphodiesterase n=1 Tax=Motiliproteus sp. MSK22-1 TaxID=1897630 RepID=UPI000975BBBD|nr:ACP phosphodiesterase [Motiliproteus sp. MSK22-1]OMH33689.1 hypothetical protein BGP75_11835 [Motiliproteus sp. MSK22-1]
MNYLAHLYFAAATPESRIGNLMGDFARGALDPDWPVSLRNGVWLHRKIDVFTDAHPCLLQARRRISPERRRLAGIILDISFDHFLSRHWSQFSSQLKTDFIREVYRDLSRYRGYLPAKMERPLKMMVEQDWLSAYHSIDGVNRALDGVSRRFSRPTNLLGAGEEIEKNYADLEKDFLEYFPQLIGYVSGLQMQLEIE